MSDTPTTGQEMQYPYKLRRRLIAHSYEESSNSVDESSPKDAKEQRLAKSSQLSPDFVPKRLTFRTTPASPFYQSVCTPSRTGSRRPAAAHLSHYRTPVISTSIKKSTPVNSAKKLPTILRQKWNQNSKYMLMKTWKFCYLGSVFEFNMEKSRLRAAYERTLKARILSVYPSYHLVVKFTPSSFLKQNPKKVDTIFVDVSSFMPGDENERDKIISVYEGIFIKTQEKVQSKACSQVNWFPLLLYSGLELIHNTFIMWLQSSFDCYIAPRCLPSSAILWVAGMWTRGLCPTKEHNKKNLQLSFHYDVRLPSHFVIKPMQQRGKFSIKLRFPIHTLIKIWSTIKEKEESSEVNLADIVKFHSAFDSVVESLTHFPKTLLRLVHVKTPCITLGINSKLRLTCRSTLNSALHHLIEIFQSTCHLNNLELPNEDLEDESESEQESP